MNIAGYFLVFLEGLLAFVSPCILPMLPVYLLYLSGKSSETPKSGEPVNASDDKGQTPAARKTSADKV